jgi:hypothetical protein
LVARSETFGEAKRAKREANHQKSLALAEREARFASPKVMTKGDARFASPKVMTSGEAQPKVKKSQRDKTRQRSMGDNLEL